MDFLVFSNEISEILLLLGNQTPIDEEALLVEPTSLLVEQKEYLLVRLLLENTNILEFKFPFPTNIFSYLSQDIMGDWKLMMVSHDALVAMKT